MLALILPQSVQRNESPEKFLVSVDEVEKETKLDFFPDLPKEMQDRIEKDRAFKMW